MPRVAGQIDRAKSEAILDAAAAAFLERGLTVGVGEIARRARVSKQTVYNHYGSKGELLRAIADRRVREITAHLYLPGAAENPEVALRSLARQLLANLAAPKSPNLARLAIIGAGETPEFARAFLEGAISTSRQRIAAFIAIEHEAGRLDAPDAMMAARIFMAMVQGPYQLEGLLDCLAPMAEQDIDDVAAEAVRRFMRAYAPAPIKQAPSLLLQREKDARP